MTDYFDRIEQGLRRAASQRLHIRWYRRIALPRSRAATVALACVAITGSALAAGGVFQTGASVGPEVPPNPRTDVGVAIPGSARLLALRVADPAGGPPWGLRTIRTTRGLICVQLGRIVGDRIGALGRDGAFKDDGRFHPLSVDYLNVGGFNCGVEDARGNAFLNEEDFALPAAGLLGGGRDVSGGCYTSPKTRAGCGPGDLRDVSYGLLGPAARAITSRSSDGSLAGSATAGPDGAYLVVLTHVEHRCAEQTLIDCVPSPGGETGGPALDVSGAVRSVSYRDGSTCHLMTAEDVAHAMKAEETRFRSVLRSRYPALYHRVFVGQNYRPGALAGLTPREARVFNATHRPFSHGFEHFSCPVVGYSPLRTSPVTSSQVAAPIHVRFEPSAFYCETPGRELAPCARRAPAGYRRIPSPRGHREELVVISFRTRIPIENYDRHYEINISYPGSAARTCPLDAAGEFGPSNSDFAAGAEVRFAQFFDTLCPGDYHVRIDLIGTSGPAGAMPVPGLPGQRHEGEVGRTHIRVR